MLFLISVWYPQLILPTAFLCLIMIGAWNYPGGSRRPAHIDAVLSQADQVDLDDLDEEFDTFRTSKPDEIVRLRYERLRNLAGDLQPVLGYLAVQGERAQSLFCWHDPRVTPVFLTLLLVAAVLLFLTPFRMVAMVMWMYYVSCSPGSSAGAIYSSTCTVVCPPRTM
jgi:hypothetical protein